MVRKIKKSFLHLFCNVLKNICHCAKELLQKNNSLDEENYTRNLSLFGQCFFFTDHSFIETKKKLKFVQRESRIS
jgi:hypothetical protein